MYAPANAKPSPNKALPEGQDGLSPKKAKRAKKFPGVPNSLTDTINGVTWDIKSFMTKDEVMKRWPGRILDGVAEVVEEELEGDEDKTRDDCGPAIAHFGTADVEDVGEVSLGDFVEVNPPLGDGKDGDGEDHYYVVKIEEMFQDTKNERYFKGRWFYKPWDTALRIEDGKDKYMPGEMDKRRLFVASDADNELYNTLNTFGTIYRKVTVKEVYPGGNALPETQCDFWYDQEHDRRFFTFTDSFKSPPASQALYESNPHPRKLNVVELYCGCGGLSFVDRREKGVHIETKWAVDMEPSMCAAFQANYPNATVFEYGVDEWLALCMHFKRLSDKYPDDWQPPPESDDSDSDMEEDKDDGNEYEVNEILSLTLIENGERGRQNQGKGQLTDRLTLENTSVKFQVEWKGYDVCNAEDEWVAEENLACEAKLAAFVQKLRRDQVIPLPGQVHVVMGGPPCQGVSGLNRHAKRAKIINDPRNRQVQAFYDVIEWFQPSFVLMENVLDIFKKQDGMYAKFAAARLLNMRYQTRLGCIAACDHGAPQGRWRAFMWGAKAGQEQLPPFPEPSHFAAFQGGVPQSARNCIVGFTSEESRDAARQMVFMGDVLSDLPAVSNFSTAEALEYASEPQRPYQMWLRRPPPPWQASAEQRAALAHAAMEASLVDQEEKRRQLIMLGGHELVGWSYHCKKRGGEDEEEPGKKHGNFAGETWRAIMDELAYDEELDSEEFEALEEEMELSQRGFCFAMGQQIAAEQEACKSKWGPLRDHRSLCLNYDDYLRCVHVPSEKDANFRKYPGVVTHPNMTCCAGHTHASVDVGGASSCGGGGTRTQAPRGITADSRVDTHDSAGWRGGGLAGCDAATVFLPTGDLLCPRWCITYKGGKSGGRHGCFGRMWYDEIQPTVVGRAEPHNLRLIHPTQDRVITIRENARCQGFPDYFSLAGISHPGQESWVRNKCLTERYQQMGNAVSPLVADAMGRCLALAARGNAPVGDFIVAVPSPEYERVMAEAAEKGLLSYVEEFGVPGEYKRMLSRKKQDADAWVLAQEVIDEAEDEEPIGDSEEMDDIDNDIDITD